MAGTYSTGSEDKGNGREITPLGDAPLGYAGEKQRLLMQTLNEAQVDFLLQRTPTKEIKYRQGRGGMQFAYVEHGYVTERLNIVFGFNWDFEIVDKQILEEEVIVEARLTVRTPGGQTIVKTQFGGADIKRHTSGQRSGRPLSIADDYKAAASDALKKCASLLGVGLDLYGRDRPDDAAPAPAPGITSPQPVKSPAHEREPEPEMARPVPEAKPRVIEMGGQGDGLCTQQQLRQISRLAGTVGMTMQELATSLHVLDLSELTEARAQRVLARLQELSAQMPDSQAS